MIDDSTIALVSAASSTLMGGLGALTAVLTQHRPVDRDDEWLRTWVTLPADVRAWVAEQYAAVELPAPTLPTRPSPLTVERR